MKKRRRSEKPRLLSFFFFTFKRREFGGDGEEKYCEYSTTVTKRGRTKRNRKKNNEDLKARGSCERSEFQKFGQVGN